MYAGSIGSAPTVKAGDTVLDIAVANSISDLIPGDTVSLVSSAGCEPDEQEGADGQATACTLADHATIMAAKAKQSGGEDERDLLTVALNPQSAIRVMKAGESGPIVAVHR